MKTENAELLKHCFQLASQLKADALLVYADVLDDFIFPGKLSKKTKLILLSRKKKIDEKESGENAESNLLNLAEHFIQIPKIPLTRLSLIKVATSLAISSEIIQPGSKIICAVGLPELNVLDSVQIIDTSREAEIISRGISKLPMVAKPELFQAVLNLAIELADKGREGKPIGTILVLGDQEKVLQFSKQMILNPFKGYSEEERNILSPGIKETIREFAALDGAIVIGDDGVVITAGRYLSASSDENTLPRGLGSRHLAASGITSLTGAVAFAISESSGDVRIFKDGKIIMHIEKAPNKK